MTIELKMHLKTPEKFLLSNFSVLMKSHDMKILMDIKYSFLDQLITTSCDNFHLY